MSRFIPIFMLAAGMLAFAAPDATACSIGNWSAKVGSQGLSTGTPAQDHRRFEGECGLKVKLGPGARYVEDDSPDGEATYFARFYFFADELELRSGQWVDLFTANRGDRGATAQLALRLEQTADGRQLVLRARDGSQMAASKGVPIAGGWTGVELSWSQATGPANGSAELEINGQSRAKLTGLDNRTGGIDRARLGAVDASDAGGSLDFDSFVSHRKTPVGPLVRGDATADQAVDASDLVAVINEMNQGNFAKGQPDCNGDGAVDSGDLQCLAREIVGR